MNKFSVINNAPAFTKGYVKEMRVRWALTEMDLPYEELKYPHAETKSAEYLGKQPFGQVPYYEEGDLCMFESGAILLHLALKHSKLMPTDEIGRAQTMTWLFSALNSIEPSVAHVTLINVFSKGQEWADLRRPAAIENLKNRLSQLSSALGEREYLTGEFSIADIAMTTVLRDVSATIIGEFANLKSYRERNEARAGFQKALQKHCELYS